MPTLDYSKWENLDVSDDDEQEATRAGEVAKMQEQMTQVTQAAQVAQADTDELNAAIDAAAYASSTGNVDMLDTIMTQAQVRAPLAPEMEAVLSTLPEAARIAARASAQASAVAGSYAGAGTCAGIGEPTLAELLSRQNISTNGSADDPGLEDPHEFFETADEAISAERQLQEAKLRTVNATAMAANASSRSFVPPNTSPQLDPCRIEELS